MNPPVLPIDCLQARESVSVQLDQELSELDSVRLSAHLRECSACSAHARSLGALTAHLRATPLERPGVEIWLPRRRAATARRTASVRATAAAAAVVVIAAGLSFVSGRYAASGGSHTATVALPGLSARSAEVAERQMLALLRDARSRQAKPAGKLIFL